MNTAAAAVILAICAVALGGCEREARRFRQPAAVASPPPENRVADLEKAAKARGRDRTGPYDGNAYSVAQGKRLFIWFNCNGCHGLGGGGMGPALMDATWIYGHEA